MSVIHFPKWFDVMTTIERMELQRAPRPYLEYLKREIDIASSYLKRIIYRLEALGLIKRVKKKNRRYIELTELGLEVVEHIRKLQMLVTTSEEDPLLPVLEALEQRKAYAQP